MTCFRVNERIAIDAGGLGFHGSPTEQEAIRHIFLTHSHIDHVAGLPIFLENVYGNTAQPPIIYGHPHTLDSLKTDVFNNRLYPDLSHLKPAFCCYETLEMGRTVNVENVRVTPLQIEHPVPTVAYRLDSTSGAVLIITDTGMTPNIRTIVESTPRLRAVFLECAFPEAFTSLAKASGHLTTPQFLAEVREFPKDVSVYAVHGKARYREVIERELAASRLPNVQMIEPGREYDFGSA